MKLSDAKTKYAANYFQQVEIRKNPGDIREYIALLYGRDGKSFMLCDDNDTVISSLELGELVLMLQQVGFRKAKIYF